MVKLAYVVGFVIVLCIFGLAVNVITTKETFNEKIVNFEPKHTDIIEWFEILKRFKEFPMNGGIEDFERKLMECKTSPEYLKMVKLFYHQHYILID